MNYNILKDLLQTSDDYGSIFDFFFQNFAEESSFYEKGSPSMNSTLPKVIKAMGENFYGKNCRITGYRMTEIEEENFIHLTQNLQIHPSKILIKNSMYQINMNKTGSTPCIHVSKRYVPLQ